MKRKNILLITADQWRGDCLSAMGHPHVKTPNFDALISDGITFDHHYSVCVPCAPARASLLTGMYLQNHRVTRNGTPLDHRHSNIAIELKKAGYRPTLFGYTDTALDPRFYSKEEVLKYGYEGIMPGFEEGLLLASENPKEWLQWLQDKGYDFSSVTDAFDIEELPKNNTLAKAGHPAKFKEEHSQTAFLTKNVIEYIDQNKLNNDIGWCVHLSYLRPHPPFVAPEPYNEMYNPDLLEAADTPKVHKDDHPYLKAAHGPLGDWPEAWIQELANSKDYDKETRQLRATYYGLITKVDHYFGKLISHLKSIGEYDNTLIIMTSDHGELMGDHGLFGKRGYFKESYHIPLIIRDPTQTKTDRGHIETSITESIDIMPTILNWIDKPIPRQCDGKSLLPFIKGKTPKNWRKEAHWEYDFYDTKSLELEKSLGLEMDDCKLNVISNDNYMFVYFANLPALFFDLRKDPNCSHNVVDQAEYAPLVLKFSQQLLSWRMHNDERVLTNYSVSCDDIYHRENS
ncbi:MAG: alkaline phosphatase family protein [Cocleimonas sp.]